MNIIAKYIHGSADSIDIDTVYVTTDEFTTQSAKEFCSQQEGENANLINIEDGIISKCYKGTPDELNNALLETYSLHKQEYPLLITRKVARNIPLKLSRSVRTVLSHISRSQYRPQVKKALTEANWKDRIDTLKSIDLSTIEFDGINKHISGPDTLKVIAFQLGQSLLLLCGDEVYTKREIADNICLLEDFLYRKSNKFMSGLMLVYRVFLKKLSNINVIQDGYVANFVDYGLKIDLNKEEIVD